MNVKRAALVLSLVAFSPAGLWAQGTIHVRVTDAMFTNATHLGYTNGQRAGAEFVCRIYAGIDTNSLYWRSNPVPFINGTADFGELVIAGLPLGTTIALQVKAWPQSYPSYEAAVANDDPAVLVGVSDVREGIQTGGAGPPIPVVRIGPLWISLLSEPALRLLQRGSWPQLPGGEAQDVVVAGNYAYVTEIMSGLHVLDIRDPAHLTHSGQYALDGNTMSVKVSGSRAFVARGANGVLVLDVSDPGDPKRVAGYDSPGYAVTLELTENHVFVADGGAGLVILEVMPRQAPALSVACVGTNALITWPAPAQGFRLESTPDLTSSNWVPLALAPEPVGDRLRVSVPAVGNQFFRLRRD